MLQHHTTIRIDSRRYLTFLIVVALILVFTHVLLKFYHLEIGSLPFLLIQLFDLDEENNLPTWFSGFLLLNAAFFLYVITRDRNLEKRTAWLVLTGGFFLLAIDEIAGLHETINTAIDINWAIPAAILLLVLAALFVPFLMSLQRKLAFTFIAAGTLYVSGAIAMELISADLSSKSMTYAMHVAMEEGLEMTGILVFLSALLDYLAPEKTQFVDVAVAVN